MKRKNNGIFFGGLLLLLTFFGACSGDTFETLVDGKDLDANASPGIALSKQALYVGEGTPGVEDSYTIALQTAPASNVTIALSSVLAADGVSSFDRTLLDPATVTFTPSNWNKKQTITASPVDNNSVDDFEGSVALVEVLHSITTDDADYAALVSPVLPLDFTDDDIFEITEVAGGAATGENTVGGITYLNDGDELPLTITLTEEITIPAGSSVDITLNTGETITITGPLGPTTTLTATYTVGDDTPGTDSTGNLAVDSVAVNGTATNSAGTSLTTDSIAGADITGSGTVYVVDNTVPVFELPADLQDLISSDNNTITLPLPEGVYASDDATGDLMLADFGIVFSDPNSSGATFDDSLVTITHNAGDNTVTFHLSAAWGGTTPDGDETITITIADGSSAYDAAGNAMADGTTTGSIPVHDLVAPVIAIDSKITNDTTPEITGTIDDTTATISVTVNSETFTATNNGDGTWTLADDTLSPLMEGLYEVEATATDAAGNASSDSTNNELDIDTTPPILAISAPDTSIANDADTITYTVTYTGASSISLATGDITVNGTGGATCSGINIVDPATATPDVELTNCTGDGTVDISIAAGTATDTAGNSAPGAGPSASFTVDNTDPVLTLNSPSSSTTVANTLVSYDLSEDVASLNIAFNGTGGDNASMSGGDLTSGTHSDLDLSLSLTDGNVYSIEYTATDAAGNSTTAQTVATDVTYDSTLAAITLSYNQSGKTSSPFKAGTLTITATLGTVPDSAPLITVNQQGTSDDISQAMSGSGTTWTYSYTIHSDDASAYVDGTATVSISATHSSGTPFASPSNTTFVIDTIAPANQDSVYSTSGEAQGGSSIAVVSSGDAANTIWFAPVGTTTFTAGSTMTSAAGDATSITAPTSEGTYVLYVIDAAGNVSAASSATLTVDNTNPSIAITSPFGGADSLTNVASQTLSGTCSDAGTIVVTTDTGSVNDGDCSDNTWSLNAITLTEGVNSITVTATDGAGNSSNDTINITLDTTAPVLAITSPTAGTEVNGSATVTFTGSEGATEASPDGTNWTSVTTGFALSSLTGWAGLAEGDFTLQLRETDTAGNTGTASVTLHKDTIAPALAITSPAASTEVNGTATVSFTGSEGATEASPDGTNWTSVTTGFALSSLTGWAGLAEGDFTLQLRETDAAGNTGTASVTLHKDTAAPTISIVSAPDITTANETAYVVSGSCSEDGRTVTVSVGGINATPTCSSSAYSTNMDVSSLGDSTSVSITADHDDAAGNTATQASTTVVKDTVAPVPGSSGTITTASVASDSLTLNWTKATDSISLQTALEYKIVKDDTAAANIDTVAEADAITSGSNLIQDWTTDIATIGATGLTQSSTYYFTVLVRDELGNTAVYSVVTETTTVATLTVTLNQASGQSDEVNALPVNFEVVFNTAIDASTFTTADINHIGTANVTSWSITNTDGGVNKAFTLTADSASTTGTIIPQILAGIVEDSGNTLTNEASTSTDNVVVYTLVKPNVTINQTGSQSDPVNSLPIEFDIVFSIAIDDTTFDIGDITETGSASGITWNLTNSGDNKNYTLQATAITGDGDVVPTISAGVISSPAGNTNNASTATDNSVTYDTVAPDATISGAPTGTNNVPTLDVDVAGTDVVSYQYAVGNGIVCSSATYSSDISVSTNITADISGEADGTITLCVRGKDAAGNLEAAADAVSASWTKNSALPVATISGTPTGTNNTTVLDITVGGTSITDYMYKVGESASTDCSNSSGYSSSTAIATHITENISGLSDGLIKLCVVGYKNPDWQDYASATVATWTKDTTPPAVADATAETMDIDNDGRLDHYKITFSSAVVDSTFPGYNGGSPVSTTDWQVGPGVSDYTNEKLDLTVSGDISNDNIIYLAFDENGTCSSADQSGCNTGSKPDLQMLVAGLEDEYGNQLATFSTTDLAEADRANPVLVYATPPSNISVNAVFSENIDATTSECGTGSSQPSTDCSTLYGITGSGGLTISKAVMSGGAGVSGKTVVLTTSTQTNGSSYTLETYAGSLNDVNNNPTVTGANTAAFTGAPPALNLVSATAIDNTTVELTFNEPVTAVTAENDLYYTIGGLTVSAAVTYPTSGVDTSTVVRLTTSSQLSTSDYTVTVTSGSVEATSDNKTCDNPNNAATFTGDTLPEVQSVTSIDQNTVFITFTENVDFSATGNGALNAANYCIELTASKTTDCSNSILAVSSPSSQVANTVVKLTTDNQTLDEPYTLTVSNVVDTTGNTVKSTANYGNFLGRESIKIISARNVDDSSDSFGVFKVAFSKPYEYDAAGTGTNSASNLSNWSFPAGLGTVTVCTSSDDSACPISYTEGVDTEIFFKATPEPAEGAYTVVGATATGVPAGAAGCISYTDTPTQCLKSNPDDRATVDWNLPTNIEGGPVYNDPFNDNITLSGQVLKYNDRLIIGPNETDSGLFMTDINLSNSTNIVLDADSVNSGYQPFRGDGSTYDPTATPPLGVYEHGTTYLGGIDYMYTGCYDNSSPYADSNLSGSNCTSAGGTEYLFVVGYVTSGGGYQSNWSTTDTVSPFIFDHKTGISNYNNLTFRAMSVRIYKGYVYQAQQHQNGSRAVRWGRFQPGGGASNNELYGSRIQRIGEDSGNSKINGQYPDNTAANTTGGLISIDYMFEYDNSSGSQMYIANGGSCREAGAGDNCLSDMVRNGDTYYDGGIVRTVSTTTAPGVCTSTGVCNGIWEDVTPDLDDWNRFMSIPLPKDASGDGNCATVSGDTQDWDCLEPANTITPSIKAVPKMVEFNSDLYAIRNSCATVNVVTLNTTTHHVCPDGDERPQLWRLPANCGAAGTCQTAWVFIGDASTHTTQMSGAEWLDGSGQATKTADNKYIALLEVVGDRLYVGFDNPVAGLNVWRTKSGITAPSGEGDFEAICQTGNACFQSEKQFGLATSGDTDLKIFDSISVNDAGTDYLIFNSRNGADPMRIYRTTND